MQKCTRNKSNGMSNKQLFIDTFSVIVKTVPSLLLVLLCSELLVGILQTGILIAWQKVVNVAEHFLRQEGNYKSLILALFISFTLYVVMDLCRMILESFYTLANSKVTEGFQTKLYDKCKTLNVIHFEDSELYNIIDRANSAIGGMVSLVGVMGIFVMGFARIATLGSYVLLKKPLLGLIVILPIVPVLVTKFIRGKDLYRLKFEQSEKRRECNYYRECVSNKETKTRLTSLYFIKKWDEMYSAINKEENKLNRKHMVVFAMLNLMKYAIYVFAIIIATMYLFKGEIDLGMFVLITGMLGTTHATIEVVVSRSGEVVESLRYAQDYFSFLNQTDDMSDEKIEVKNSIKLENVSFQYPNSDEYILKNINMSIKEGEKIALVGVNGAGKTTLAKIIMGLYNPVHGEVFVDGKRRNENLLLDGVVVFQDFCRYYFTLRENVGFGDMNKINEDTLLLKKLEEFQFDISKTNSSLDTQLGRAYDGMELSGGEWQKIALARGFMKQCGFIILDEPNAGLDPLTESEIFKCFMKQLENQMGIIITHRIGIAAIADRIVLLDGGSILEEGVHEELMKAQGYYYKMFEAQANMYS